MINIKTFFINHFATDRITDDRLKAFCQQHISRLTAWLTVHTDPELSALLTAVMTKYNSYFGAITDEGTKLAIQKGLTIAATNAWTAALDFIRQQEGTVKGVWGKDSVEYEQFYPRGLDEYNQANRLNKDSLLVRYLTVATAYTAELPADFVADYTTLKNDYSTKYSAQQQQIGLVKDADSQTANTREPLDLQLSLNMLIIGSKNIGYPDRVSDFFNQSIIRRKRNSFPATSLEIRGKVTVEGSTTPVVSAIVMLEDVETSLVKIKASVEDIPATTTDDQGRYKFLFTDLPAGASGVLKLIIDAPGFQHYEQIFPVTVGEVIVMDVPLALGLRKAA